MNLFAFSLVVFCVGTFQPGFADNTFDVDTTLKTIKNLTYIDSEIKSEWELIHRHLDIKTVDSIVNGEFSIQGILEKLEHLKELSLKKLIDETCVERVVETNKKDVNELSAALKILKNNIDIKTTDVTSCQEIGGENPNLYQITKKTRCLRKVNTKSLKNIVPALNQVVREYKDISNLEISMKKCILTFE